MPETPTREFSDSDASSVSPVSAAVIVGGGAGSRFGGDKLTILLAGKPLLAWSLLAFQQTDSIACIVVVAPPGSEEKFREIARAAGITKLLRVVAGGAQRHQSVLNGLKALPPTIEFVAIHDAARPLVTPDLVTRALIVAVEAGAAAAGTPVTDTLHQADQQNCAVRTMDRTGLWAMQTPQVFLAVPLLKLLEEVPKVKPTDEVSIVLAAGWRVPFVQSLQSNLKVTWPEDLAIAEALLQSRVSPL